MLPLTGSVFARTISTVLSAPIENAATLVMDGQKNSIKLNSSKFLSLFTGLSLMMGHEIALTASWWIVYHNSFLFLSSNVFPDSRSDVAPALMSSVISSFVAAVVSHPCDIAKVMKVLDPTQYADKNTFSILKSLMKNHGYRSLAIGKGE